MVERLAEAIAKARRQREAQNPGAGVLAPPAPPAPPDADAAWRALETLTLDPRRLERERIVTGARSNPLHISFDVLRTRMMKLCAENGWRRIGITSPTKSCGKTMIVANLALSLARHPDARAMALDFDFREPCLAARLGVAAPGRLADMLTGAARPETILRRVDDRLALALNDRRERDSAELIHSAETAVALNALATTYAPTLLLFDLPPVLACDDALASLDLLDGVLLVAAAGQTTPAQIEESRQALDQSGRLIGVLLNKAEPSGAEPYAYGGETP